MVFGNFFQEMAVGGTFVATAFMMIAITQIYMLDGTIKNYGGALNRDAFNWDFFASSVGYFAIWAIAFFLLRNDRCIILPMSDEEPAQWILTGIALAPMPPVMLSLLCSLYWPSLGYAENYRANLEADKGPIGHVMKLFENLKISRWYDVPRFVVNWCLLYIIGTAAFLHFSRTRRRFEKKNNTRILYIQIGLDIVLLSSLFLGLVAILLALALAINGPFGPAVAVLKVMFAGAFAVSLAGQVGLMLAAAVCISPEEGLVALYVPKEIAGRAPRHSATPLEAVSRSNSSAYNLEIAGRRREILTAVCLATVVALALALGGLSDAGILPPTILSRTVGRDLAVTAGLILIIRLGVIHQREVAEIWRSTGLRLGALLPVHFVRQAVHRLVNSLEVPAFLVKALMEELGTAPSGEPLVVPPDTAIFLNRRAQGAAEAIRRIQMWVDTLRADSLRLQDQQSRWLDPKLDLWTPLDAVVKDVMLESVALRHRLPLASGGKVRLSYRIEAHGQILAAELKSDLDIPEFGILSETEIRIDRSSLNDALSNIIRNGFQACAARSESVRSQERLFLDVGVTIEAGATSPLLIKIKDSGGGIPEAQRPHVFEPYFSTKGLAGSGLGLFMVREFLRALGGRITFTTSQTTNPPFTEFAITLPHRRVRIGRQ